MDTFPKKHSFVCNGSFWRIESCKAQIINFLFQMYKLMFRTIRYWERYLQIAFSTIKTRRVCVSLVHARRELGDRAAGSLKLALADLRAALSIDDLIANPPVQYGESDGLLIRLIHNLGLAFEQNHIKPPLLDSGGIDWSNVTRIKILGIVSL